MLSLGGLQHLVSKIYVILQGQPCLQGSCLHGLDTWAETLWWISGYTQEKSYKLLRDPTSLAKIFPTSTGVCWRCQADVGTLLHMVKLPLHSSFLAICWGGYILRRLRPTGPPIWASTLLQQGNLPLNIVKQPSHPRWKPGLVLYMIFSIWKSWG